MDKYMNWLKLPPDEFLYKVPNVKDPMAPLKNNFSSGLSQFFDKEK